MGIGGLDLIEDVEGFRPKMYKDAVGLPTIGYGTLIDTADEKYLLTATVTREQAEVLLRKDIAPMEGAINKMVTAPICQNQFDALLSFCYNLGVNSLRNSTLLKKLNKNPYDPSILWEFDKWVHAGGQKLPGLITRRKLESKLYFTT